MAEMKEKPENAPLAPPLSDSPSESGAAGADVASQALSTYRDLQSKLLLSNIPTLDGVRAISVFLVIFYHLGLQLGPPILPGPLGVLAFFVLSGFLITWLLLKEDEKYGSVSLKGFYKRRTLRIFPAFYAFWLVSLLARFARGGDIPWTQAFSAFFYVSDYHHAIFRPQPEYMMHTWSLGVEEQFYLLWPLCFLAFGKKRRSLIAGLSAVILAVWIHRIHLWTAFHARDYISYAFDTRIDAILVGCLLALLLKEGLGKKLLERVCQPVWGPAISISLIVASVLAEQSSAGWSQAYRLMCGLAIEPFLVALLLCQLIVQSSVFPWKWLNREPILYLGRISYPLYLYHGFSSALAERLTGTAHKVVFVLATVLVSVVVASGSYFFVEKPFLALKKRSENRRIARAVPVSAQE